MCSRCAHTGGACTSHSSAQRNTCPIHACGRSHKTTSGKAPHFREGVHTVLSPPNTRLFTSFTSPLLAPPFAPWRAVASSLDSSDASADPFAICARSASASTARISSCSRPAFSAASSSTTRACKLWPCACVCMPCENRVECRDSSATQPQPKCSPIDHHLTAVLQASPFPSIAGPRPESST